MNEQPAEIVSQFLAVIVGIIGFISFLSSLMSGKTISLDHFDIGYIVETPPRPAPRPKQASRPKPVSRPKPAPKPAPKPKQVKIKTQVSKNQQHTKFQQDCIDVLIKLGFGKREAKSRMHMLLAKYSPTTLQEFIQVAFKREHT